MASSNAKKRKLASYSLAFKKEVIEEVKSKKLKKTEICKKHGIAPSTLSTFLKNEDKIMDAYFSSSFQPDRKRMRLATENHQQIEAALLTWFKQTRATQPNVPIDGPVLIEKAISIAEELGIEFEPNPAWLQRFKTRNGIVFKKVIGEAGSVSQETVDNWKDTAIPHLLEEF